MDDTDQTKLAFSRGFDRGNYGQAYESQDWDSWWSFNCTVPTPWKGTPAERAYADGCLLGFYSTHDISEIADDCHAETVDALRKQYGQED